MIVIFFCMTISLTLKWALSVHLMIIITKNASRPRNSNRLYVYGKQVVLHQQDSRCFIIYYVTRALQCLLVHSPQIQKNRQYTKKFVIGSSH